MYTEKNLKESELFEKKKGRGTLLISNIAKAFIFFYLQINIKKMHVPVCLTLEL